MIASLYRNIIPENFRNKIYEAFLGKLIFIYRHWKIFSISKLTYLTSWLLPKNDKNKALAFIGKHGITHYPGEYSLPYLHMQIDVLYDSTKSLHFVLHNNKKLYFPKSYCTKTIKKLYVSLITEQDPSSAHRYVNSYDDLKGKTLYDIGCAEGIFSLDTIEFTDQVVLFEFEDFWMEPLNATFEPWKNKVTIVQKYISNLNNEKCTTIDTYLADREKNNLFFKLDIEGAEQDALKGAEGILKNGKNLNIAICTYHKEDDPEVISKILNANNFHVEFTKGFLFWGNRLNKALIRASKS